MFVRKKASTTNNNYKNEAYRQPIVSSSWKSIWTIEIVLNINSYIKGIISQQWIWQSEKNVHISLHARTVNIQRHKSYNATYTNPFVCILPCIFHDNIHIRLADYITVKLCIRLHLLSSICTCRTIFLWFFVCARFEFIVSSPKTIPIFCNSCCNLDIGLYGKGELAQFSAIYGFDIRSLEWGTCN